MKVCIFGASSESIDPIYMKETEKLGCRLALKGCSLVTGGGKRGLMGAANRGFTEGNGYIISIAPRIFNVNGILYDEFNELYLTRDLVDRKQLMIEISDCFIGAPGGLGTFDELFEIITQTQLGYTAKPVIFFNIAGFYDGLWEYLQQCCRKGFIPEGWQRLCHKADSVEEVLEILNLQERGR